MNKVMSLGRIWGGRLVCLERSRLLEFCLKMFSVMCIDTVCAVDSTVGMDHAHGAGGAREAEAQAVTDPIIIWWTPFTGEKGRSKMCGKVKCFFTVDRHYQNHPQTKVGPSAVCANIHIPGHSESQHIPSQHPMPFI